MNVAVATRHIIELTVARRLAANARAPGWACRDAVPGDTFRDQTQTLDVLLLASSVLLLCGTRARYL